MWKPKSLQLLTAVLLLSGTLATAGAAQEAAKKKEKEANNQAGPSPAEKAFTDGRDALYKGQYTKAIELLVKAVKLDKTKMSYRLNLARAYRHAEKFKEAEGLLVEILKTAHDHVEAGQLLAEIYAFQKRWDKLVEVLEPLLKFRHDYPTYHLLAEAYFNLDSLAKARKYYREAIKLNPNSASDHYQLGNIHLASNRFALAAESYQAALRLGVDSPVLHYKLASAFFNLRNYFGRVSVVNVKSGKPGSISGSWYLIEQVPGKKDSFLAAPSNSAVYQVSKAVVQGLPNSPDIQMLKANIYLNAHRFDQAYKMFEQLEGKIPKEDKALLHYNFAQSAFGIGRFEQYIAQLKEAIKLDKESYESALIDGYLKVAEQHNQAGKLDEYIKYLLLAVEKSSQTVSLHLKLGNAFEENLKFDKALAQWRMVLELEPDHPQRTKLVNLIDKYRKRSAKAKAGAKTKT